jgi:erythromycin esterase-like protein
MKKRSKKGLYRRGKQSSALTESYGAERLQREESIAYTTERIAVWGGNVEADRKGEKEGLSNRN